jgi:hypothetical protein
MRYFCEFPARGLLAGHCGVHDGAPFALHTRAR